MPYGFRRDIWSYIYEISKVGLTHKAAKYGTEGENNRAKWRSTPSSRIELSQFELGYLPTLTCLASADFSYNHHRTIC